jgi:hypothetical protein
MKQYIRWTPNPRRIILQPEVNPEGRKPTSSKDLNQKDYHYYYYG